LTGFSSQANEFSTYMLLASNYILNQTTTPFSHLIFPHIHSFSNHLTTQNHLLRRVLIPDIVPAQVLGESSGQGGDFSLVAGDFEEVYGDDPEQAGTWGAVVTCFFIDCVSANSALTFLMSFALVFH
jgi:carnosine N-methyltransferase